MRLKAIAIVAALVAATPAAAQYGAPEFTWTGFRAGVHTGYFLGTTVDNIDGAPPVAFATNGFFGGMQLGYDQAIGRFVIGIGGEVMLSNIYGDYMTGTHYGYVDHSLTTTVLGRLGFAFGRTLVYATAGFNFSKVWTGAGENGMALDEDNVTFHSGIWPGYGRSIGFGIERIMSHGISINIEYRYVYIGDELISLAPTYPGDNHFVSIGGHTIRIGITSRFGGWALR